MYWKNKVVLITGASSGIGEAIAIAIAAKGAAVGLVARRAQLLEDLAKRCAAIGGKAIPLPADVCDADAMRASANELIREFGPIDILIANAGIGGTGEAARRYEPAAVKEVIDINLIGAVNAVAAVLPSMLETGSGHLVAISSLAGFRGLPGSAPYSASKAAMTAYFESLRLDLTRKGIAVTIIQPGFIRTPLTSGRANKMPFLMELDDAVPHFLSAIQKRRAFSAFPWQLATIVRAGRLMPAWLYDRIAGRVRYRE